MAEQATTRGAINLVKVFSATRVADRYVLGQAVERWIAANPTARILKIDVTQSSGRKGHCISIVIACAVSA